MIIIICIVYLLQLLAVLFFSVNLFRFSSCIHFESISCVDKDLMIVFFSTLPTLPLSAFSPDFLLGIFHGKFPHSRPKPRRRKFLMKEAKLSCRCPFPLNTSY